MIGGDLQNCGFCRGNGATSSLIGKQHIPALLGLHQRFAPQRFAQSTSKINMSGKASASMFTCRSDCANQMQTWALSVDTPALPAGVAQIPELREDSRPGFAIPGKSSQGMSIAAASQRCRFCGHLSLRSLILGDKTKQTWPRSISKMPYIFRKNTRRICLSPFPTQQSLPGSYHRKTPR